MVLGGGSQQCDAADIDLLDRFLKRNAWSSDGGLERVEVAYDEIDGLQVVCGQISLMFGAGCGQYSRMDRGMEGLDAPAQ